MAFTTYNLAKKLYKKAHDKGIELGEANFAYQDGMLIWLIGFAVTGMFLMISNYDKLPNFIKPVNKLIFILFALTIIIGISYRAIQIILKHLNVPIHTFFMGVYNEDQIPPITYDENELNKMNYEQLIHEIASDFNEQIPHVTEEQHKQIETPKLKQHYIDLCNHSKREFEIASEEVAANLETVLKIKKATTMNRFKNSKIGYDVTFWDRVSLTLYFISVGCFLLIIILMTVLFMVYS